jgi:hypothetical protein
MEELTEKIFKEFGCKHKNTEEFINTLLEAVKRFEKKQEIFSTENISDWGLVGLASRIGSYYSEIKKYLSVSEDKRIELMLTDEKLKKVFIDLGIFAFIAYIYQNGKWEE